MVRFRATSTVQSLRRAFDRFFPLRQCQAKGEKVSGRALGAPWERVDVSRAFEFVGHTESFATTGYPAMNVSAKVELASAMHLLPGPSPVSNPDRSCGSAYEPCR
jgi:hypothetical protein